MDFVSGSKFFAATGSVGVASAGRLTAEGGDCAGELGGGLEAGVAIEAAGGFTGACGIWVVVGGFCVAALAAGFAASSSNPTDSKSSCPELNFIVMGVLQYWHFVRNSP